MGGRGDAAACSDAARRRGRAPARSPQPLIEALDVAISRLVARMLPGDRRAAGVGVGTELAQLRPYEIGDDVRHIDPAATARTGQLHVRLHVPERALTTWIVLDLSPSMAFGTARRLKADVAEGVGARVRAARGPPGGQRRPGRVRRRDAAGAAAARRQARASCAVGACSRRASRPTASTIPTRLATAPRAASAGWRASPGWWS